VGEPHRCVLEHAASSQPGRPPDSKHGVSDDLEHLAAVDPSGGGGFVVADEAFRRGDAGGIGVVDGASRRGGEGVVDDVWRRGDVAAWDGEG